MSALKKIIGSLILILYCLVIAVAFTKGPLISLQSFVLGLIGLVTIIFITSSIAKAINLVDIPDGIRKTHKGNIPLIGGLTLFISFIYGAFVFGVNEFYFYVILSLVPIAIVGTLDGIRQVEIHISFRLVAQILSSWIIILFTDVYLRDLGNLFGQGPIELGAFGIPVTIFGVVGICNAFNMLDGRDGLLGSMSVVVISCLLFWLYFNNIIFNMGLVMIASLVVFLAFNLNFFGLKSKIFLGDHGSNGLGHIIAWTLIFLSQEEDLITPISAIWFLFIPISDALLTIIRRLRSKRSIFIADNKHFHHMLSEMGFTNRITLTILVMINLLCGIFAIFSNYYNLNEYNLFFGYITVLIILMLLSKENNQTY